MNRKYTVIAPEAGRLDAILATQIPDLSRSALQKAINDGYVTINGTITTKQSHATIVGAEIVVELPERSKVSAESGNLDIIFEDDHILVINKPVGLVVHPTEHRREGTLVNILLNRYPAISQAILEAGNPISEDRPGIVHRLDRETSGLLVITKTRNALLALQAQFAERSVEKTYQTVLYGALHEAQDVVAPIQRRGTRFANRMVASHKGEGKPAHTTFSPIETSAPHAVWPRELATLVHVTLHTGRTHQIRAHAKFIGHPVLGDPVYCNKPSQKLSGALNLSHQLLEAFSLSFTHPTTSERMTFVLPQRNLVEFIDSFSTP